MTPARKPIPWGPVAIAVGATVAVLAVVSWYGSLKFFDREIQQIRADLKKSVVSGRVPPTQEVMDYLQQRQGRLQERYNYWVDFVTAPSADAAVTADLQLMFQEQLHDVQQMLQRVTAARGMTVPEQLGFPKELPPSEAAPRLLAQLTLIKDVTTILFDQGLISLNAVKLEDPETVTEQEAAETKDKDQHPFLIRLPIRVRLTATLPQVIRILGAMQQSTHLIDVRSARLLSNDTNDHLELELILARYLQAPSLPRATTPPSTERRR